MTQIESLESGEKIEEDEPIIVEAVAKNESAVHRFFKSLNWGSVGKKVACFAAFAIPGAIAIINGLKK